MDTSKNAKYTHQYGKIYLCFRTLYTVHCTLKLSSNVLLKRIRTHKKFKETLKVIWQEQIYQTNIKQKVAVVKLVSGIIKEKADKKCWFAED